MMHVRLHVLFLLALIPVSSDLVSLPFITKHSVLQGPECVTRELSNVDTNAIGTKYITHLEPHRSFCEVFTPCIEFDMPDTLFNARYHQDVDLYAPAEFVILMSFDSAGVVKYARVNTVMHSSKDCIDESLKLMRKHIQRYLSDMIGTARLKSDMVTPGLKADSTRSDEKQRFSDAAQRRHFVLEIMTRSNYIHALWLGTPDDMCFRYFVP